MTGNDLLSFAQRDGYHSAVFEVKEYFDAQGRPPFRRWIDRLRGQAAVKVTAALDRMGRGIPSNTNRVVPGVSKYRIVSRPGYRIYFVRDGETLVGLLGALLQCFSPESVGSGAVRRKGFELTMASTSAENR